MPVAKATSAEPKLRPRVLVVDDEPNLVELISDVVRSMDCRIVTATTIADARRVLIETEVDVLVTDVHLPDGDGTVLLGPLHRRHPTASAIVITGSPSVDNAVSALRQGAVDFIPKPFTTDQLIVHVRKALELQAQAAKDDRKVQRLRLAVKRLNEARKLISKKVDILCNDLVSAYGELSRQLDNIRTQEGFRKYIDESADLEQLLCHAMDWMLRQIGYANVGVWLAGEDGAFQLGAYMKYTVAGDAPVTEAMQRVILPMTDRDGQDTSVHLKAEALRDRLTPAEYAQFRGQDILAITCTYLGEPLAGLVFFREDTSAFLPEDEALLKSIAPIFAVALASVVRQNGEDEDDNDEQGGGGLKDEHDGPGPRDEGKGKRREQKKDPADWWKRGESPPF